MPASIAGCGTAFLGGRDYRSDSSYTTTEFVTAFFLPLIPIRSFRVIKVESAFRTLGPRLAYAKAEYRTWRVPICWKQVGHVYLTPALGVGSIAILLKLMGNKQRQGPLNGLAGHTALLTVLFTLAGVWPLLLGLILQHLAKRKAGWKPYSYAEDPIVAKGLEEIRQLAAKNTTKK